MSDPQEPPRGPPAAPLPLDYRPPRHTRGPSPALLAFVAQFIAGFVAATLLVLTLIPVTGPGPMSDAIWLAVRKLSPLIVGFAVLIVVLHVKLRWRGFTAGAVAGLAIGALCVGTCAVIAE